MHFSDYPDNVAGCCVLSGSTEDPAGFLNLEVAGDPKRTMGQLVVSVSRLRELGTEVGLFSPDEVQILRNEIAGLKLELELIKAEREQFEAEADALYTLAGPKLWGKAQHIRKNAGFWGRKKVNAIQAFAKDEITEDELKAVFEQVDDRDREAVTA